MQIFHSVLRKHSQQHHPDLVLHYRQEVITLSIGAKLSKVTKYHIRRKLLWIRALCWSENCRWVLVSLASSVTDLLAVAREADTCIQNWSSAIGMNCSALSTQQQLCQGHHLLRFTSVIGSGHIINTAQPTPSQG